jgi:hypothetical protein
MKTPLPHVGAVLKLPKSTKEVSGFTSNILTCMTNNANFPTPNPPLATVEADLTAFSAAESAVLTRVKGAAETRNVKLATLKGDLDHLLAYVQGIADANPGNAEAIITSAGLSVRKVTLHPKSDLKAEPGDVSGSVKLLAKAVAPRASYEWQYSTDQKTWTSAPVTLQAKTVISGLTIATAYFFRCRGVIKAGEQDWTQTVTIVVT